MKPEIVSGARRRALHALLAIASLAAPAFAPARDSGDTLAGLAVYDGVDRQQRLLEGARREGFLALYTSFPPDDVAALNAARHRLPYKRERLMTVESAQLDDLAV